MINVLLNAYAVAPNWGSEQGLGWNWVINLAKYCNVYVITEGEWQKEIMSARCAGIRETGAFTDIIANGRKKLLK